MNKSKVIFLDIDGVLNTGRSMLAYRKPCFEMQQDHIDALDQLGIDLLLGLQYRGNVKFVLSSTWRASDNYKELARLTNLDLIDRTPIIRTKDSIRGDEIKVWLDKHPEVSHYAILDDDCDMLEEQMQFLVLTDGMNGISHKNILDLYRILDVEL